MPAALVLVISVVLDEQIIEILVEPPEFRRGLDTDLEELVEADEALLPGSTDDDGPCSLVAGE